jgi:hypothetical protein
MKQILIPYHVKTAEKSFFLIRTEMKRSDPYLRRLKGAVVYDSGRGIANATRSDLGFELHLLLSAADPVFGI